MAVIGRTGSGKTQFAVYALLLSDWQSKPWIVIDYKRDALINSIGGTRIRLDKPVPEKPGIYLLQPNVGQEDEVEAYLWKIWHAENIGVFVDEGYMIGDNNAFRALLTQGRSKNISMIILSQRPVWISRFVWSEADYYVVFKLNTKTDQKNIREFFQYSDEPLPQYHSWFRDVSAGATKLLRPAPEASKITEEFRNKKRAMRFR